MSTIKDLEDEREELITVCEISASVPSQRRRRLTGNRYMDGVTFVSLFSIALLGALGLYWKGDQNALRSGFQNHTDIRSSNHSIHQEGEQNGLISAFKFQNQTETGSTNASTQKAIATRQIENFRRGDGIMINFHVVHHGGTTVCLELSESLRHPSFACLHPVDDNVTSEYPKTVPWTYNDTAKNINIVQQYFQFISWEFLFPPRKDKPQIPDMDLENPHLISLNGTEEAWMKFANDTRFNNYALRVLSNYSCCDNANTSVAYLEMAKKLVQRFTFVLDIACLERGLEKVADTLGFSLAHHPKLTDSEHKHATVEERIPFPKAYSLLKERNKLNIELHEFAKSLAVVDCEAE